MNRAAKRETLVARERERESGREHSARLVDWLAGRPARDNAMQWKSSATPYRGLVYTNHRPMEAIILICWPSIEPLSSFRSRIIKVAGRREQTRGRAYTRAFAYGEARNRRRAAHSDSNIFIQSGRLFALRIDVFSFFFFFFLTERRRGVQKTRRSERFQLGKSRADFERFSVRT